MDRDVVSKCLLIFLSLCAAGLSGAQSPAKSAVPLPPTGDPAANIMREMGGPSKPAQMTRVNLHLDAVSALELAWWFQHIADEDGKYWKLLEPGSNKAIQWRVNPREDSHQLIGAMYMSEQLVGGGLFPNDTFTVLAQFQDYVTQNRNDAPGQPRALNQTLSIPSDYSPPYPSPLLAGFMGDPADPHDNGFNEQVLLSDGLGFSQGRVLISWKNTGSDDTASTQGRPYGVDIAITMYQVWMEGSNRPPTQHSDGYYYNPAQVKAIEALWQRTFQSMPKYLPAWFNKDTQDDIARSKGYTVTSVIDTGVVEGVNSKMMVWWWNHAMGDAPGISYSYWCPPAHHAIRWLPGFSPAEVLKSDKIPTDRVVPGIIYPDLQGGNLMQTGGGMMAYPVAMSPVPGVYKTLDPMMVISQRDVDNFAKVRFPIPRSWLLHQWEDRPDGLIHRSTVLGSLPLVAPVTQQGFYSEHQLMEGQFWGTTGMRKAYAAWLKAN